MKRRTMLAAGLCLAAPPLLQSCKWNNPTVDVLVIGGGAAGLCAAIAARQAGANSVLLLEKNAALGGDTLISGGYFNAVTPPGTPGAKEDNVELFTAQILKNGGGFADPELAHSLALLSAPTLQWLQSLGMTFLPQVFEIYGSIWPRAHKPVLPRGQGYIRTLSASAVALGVEIRTNTRVLQLLRRATGSAITAVRAETEKGTITIAARQAIILASGGFAASRSKLREYAPDYADFPVDSQPGSTGDLLDAAQAIQAKTEHLSFIECVPGSSRKHSYPIRLDYKPNRMIFVNEKGLRFVDETGSRRTISAAIIAQRPLRCFSIADAATVAGFDSLSQKNLYRGLYSGVAWRADTPQKLGQIAGIDPQQLALSIQQEAQSRHLLTAPFWAAEVHLRVHSTLGGLVINNKGQVLDQQGQVIPHLWAAGSIVGNMHGIDRIGGNGLAFACTFGRRCGTLSVRLA